LSSDLFDSVLSEPVLADLSSLLPLETQVAGPRQPTGSGLAKPPDEHARVSTIGTIGSMLPARTFTFIL
jgi:hypothetical protein